MSYVFDTNTPMDERSRRRKLAEALMLKATDAGPIASPWQGAAKMAQALMGGIELGMYDKQDREDRDYRKGLDADLGGTGTPAVSSVTSALAAPPSFAQYGTSGPSPGYVAKMLAGESGGDAGVVNPKSGATGSFQFLPSTWNGLVRSMPQLGLTPEGIKDPQQQKIAMNAFTEQNAGILSKAGIPINDATLSIAHQQGAGGATALLTNPSANAVDVLTPAYKGNRALAMRAVVDNGGDPNMTAGEFASKVAGYYNKQGGGAPAGMMAVGSGAPVDAARIKRLEAIAFDDRASPQQQAKAKYLLQQMQKEAPKYGFTVAPDGTVLRTEEKGGTVQPIGNFAKPDPTTERKNYEADMADRKARGMPDQPYGEWLQAYRRSGANSNTVNVGGGSDKQIFDSMLDEYKGVKAAVTGLNAIQEARKALNGGGIFGAGADFNLGLQKVGALLGVTDPTKIQNTETFRAAIAPQVSAMLKSTVGSSQISNTDREFAEKAAGGSISLDEGSIRRLLTIMDKAARAQIDDFTGRLNDVYPESEDGKFKRERAIMRAPKLPDFIPDAVPGVMPPSPAGGGVPAPAAPSPTAQPQKIRRYNPSTRKFEDVSQ